MKIFKKYPELSDWSIITVYRGSIAHGLYVPSSNCNSIDDKDIISICIPPIEYYFGLEEYGSRGTREIKDNEWDIVVYEFKKCIQLLKQGNPNSLSILWTDKDCYLKVSEEGRKLLRARDLFVGKHVYHSFVGYGKSQLHRMTHLAFQGYMGEKRKTLVRKFGYDTKNACHLIRLLKMAVEFLKNGELIVKRKDADYLLSIKRGEWPLEQVEKESKKLFKQAEEAFKRSRLPETPDYKKIDKLCVEILKGHFKFLR
jgi:predicted nucleotidyltransferase